MALGTADAIHHSFLPFNIFGDGLVQNYVEVLPLSQGESTLIFIEILIRQPFF